MKRFAIPLALAVVIAGAICAQAPPRVAMIAGNGTVNVLVEVDGSVKTWGKPNNEFGLGDGEKPARNTDVKTPRLLGGVAGIADAAVGSSHALLLARDGTVFAWGRNDVCQLGNGTGKTAYAPLPVPGLRGVKQVAANAMVSAAVLDDGTVWMWGDARDGLMGNGLSGWRTPCVKTPMKVEGLDHVVRVSFDETSALAVKDDGTVWGWGKNDHGELCDGTTEPRLRPFAVKSLANVVQAQVAANSVMVLGDGTVRMCGKDVDGELADPAHQEHLTPFKIPGVTNARSAQIASGTTIVRLADGTLRGWGNGYYGALGDGRGDSSSSRPHAPTGLGPVLAHYMSSDASYAIRADGTVMVWCVPAPPGEKTEFILTPRPAFTVKVSE